MFQNYSKMSMGYFYNKEKAHFILKKFIPWIRRDKICIILKALKF